jgi:hypothetical protein
MNRRKILMKRASITYPHGDLYAMYCFAGNHKFFLEVVIRVNRVSASDILQGRH